VDSGFNSSDGGSIAVDSNNNPHISYCDENGDLKYASRNGSAWNLQTVDSTDKGGYYSSIAVDSKNNPHISYYDDSFGGYLKYAEWNGSAWSISTVGGNVVPLSSIAVDSNDRPHISYVNYHRYMNGTNYDLLYAMWNGSVGIHGAPFWNIQTVDNSGVVGLYSSIAVDSNNNPHIIYNDGGLKYASWGGSTWSIQTVDSTEHIDEFSMALDANNNPHIIYRILGNLFYAAWNGSAWSIQTVDSGSVGYYCSIAVDSNNNPHISYYDATNGNDDLKYASFG